MSTKALRCSLITLPVDVAVADDAADNVVVDDDVDDNVDEEPDDEADVIDSTELDEEVFERCPFVAVDECCILSLSDLFVENCW